MRSSKSRSRNTKNRNRQPGGNNQNRVFDSSGPEGKVRGTPQQIIDKYNQLARDALLSNDRVAVENFQQHAEHYARMLADSQRELEAKREQQETQNRERQQKRDSERVERQQQTEPQPEAQSRPQPQDGGDVDPASAPQPEMVTQTAPDKAKNKTENTGSGLVETPENKPVLRKRTRKPKAKPVEKPTAKTDAAETDAAE